MLTQSSKEEPCVKKKRKWIRWVVLLLLAALLVLGFVRLNQQTKSAAYTEVTATEGDLTTYYNFDGLVRAPSIQTLTAGEAGTVRTVYVQQNQQVRKGDRIYRLDGGETVKADLSGEVTGLFVKEGDVVTAGMTVAEIIDMDRLEAELDVDEYDVKAVTPGTPVSVTILATDEQIDGQVSVLNKNGTASGDLSYYTVTVPVSGLEGAYPGMQVSAKVLREHAEGAVLLRLDAVQFDEYNKPFVYMASGEDEPAKVPVTVGVSDGITCEITSGLSAGDTVLKPSGMSMKELMEMARQSRTSRN